MPEITGMNANPFEAFQTSASAAIQKPAAQQGVSMPNPMMTSKPDTFEKQGETKKENTDKIGILRLAFKRLTQKQIDNVNETKQLPKKAKFRQTITGPSGGFTVQNNFFNLTNGTRTLPEGYEVRKNKLGFTRVVPKDSEGFWLKKKKTDKAR